jgi:hypothetical protein
MGGSKARDVPSNIVVLCSWMNSAIESNAKLADVARDYGWKLRSFEDPATTPVYYQRSGAWFMLSDDCKLTEVMDF